ncbi:DUF6615 family protein [Gordonia amicalis]|uniref:DUF6615 family protein n=1 Tax=Gordonia amicalis TaxID=89053 RepID=UPI0037C0EAB7
MSGRAWAQCGGWVLRLTGLDWRRVPTPTTPIVSAEIGQLGRTRVPSAIRTIEVTGIVRGRANDERVHRYSQVAERTSGADWEWWLGDESNGWFGLRVQAKRSHGTAYTYLDHPGDREGEYQYDTIIRECESDVLPVLPLHVFYNGWDAARFRGQDTSCIRRTPWPYRGIYDWGCSALSSYAVRSLHYKQGRDRAKIVRYLEHTKPWSELFRERATAAGSLAERVLRHTLDLTISGVGNPFEIPSRYENFQRGELPSYVREVLASEPGQRRINMAAPTRLVAVLPS